jgi:hypothetical protein
VQRFAGSAQRVCDPAAQQDRTHQVQPELELGHDPEVAAASAKSPEKFWVLLLVRAQRRAVRGHHLGGEQIVTRKSAAAHQMPQATAQGETGDARGRDQPTRCGQPVPLGGLVEDTPGDSPSRLGPASPDVDLDGLHRRQVDDDAVVTGRVAGDVVGAAADSNAKPGVGSELQGSSHVRGAGAPRDYGRSTIDHAVPDPACEVVIMMPGHDHLTGDLTGEPTGVDGRHGGHLPTVDAPRSCQPAIRTFRQHQAGSRCRSRGCARCCGLRHGGPGAVAREADRLDIVVRAPTTSAARRPGMAGGGASTRWADC